MKPILLIALALLLTTPTALAALPETPLADDDGDGNMELDRVCIWGFPDSCVVQAYECFQPYRPGFGINCI